MSSKVDKSDELTRQRSRNYRKRQKLKRQSSSHPAEEQDSISQLPSTNAPNSTENDSTVGDRSQISCSDNSSSSTNIAQVTIDVITDADPFVSFNEPSIGESGDEEDTIENSFSSFGSDSEDSQNHPPIRLLSFQLLQHLMICVHVAVMSKFPDWTVFQDSLVTRISKEVSKDVSQMIQKSQKKVMHELDSVKQDVKAIEKSVLARLPVQDLSNVITVDDLKNIYGFNFPLTDYNEFQKFDLQILNNYKDIRSNLTKYIAVMTSPMVDAEDSIGTILRKLIHKSVLILYTPQKPSSYTSKKKSPDNSTDDSIDDSIEGGPEEQSSKSDKKTIFKDTNFFKMFRDSFFKIYNTTEKSQVLSDRTILKAIGAIINSMKTCKNKGTSENNSNGA